MRKRLKDKMFAKTHECLMKILGEFSDENLKKDFLRIRRGGSKKRRKAQLLFLVTS